MKISHNIFLILLLAFNFTFINVSAQNKDENSYIINQYFQNIKLEKLKVEESNLLNQKNINNKSNYNSEVAIQQTGNYNRVNVNAKIKKLEISQIGNSNDYEFLTYYNAKKINFEAQQVGNNNQLQVFGQNSIIDNMKVVQYSNNKTITITNF